MKFPLKRKDKGKTKCGESRNKRRLKRQSRNYKYKEGDEKTEVGNGRKLSEDFAHPETKKITKQQAHLSLFLVLGNDFILFSNTTPCIFC